MTWRELARQILLLPDECLDSAACVWLPDDCMPMSEFPYVIALSPYDGSEPVSIENFPSINIEEA